MGSRPYGDEEPVSHPFVEFTGNFICAFLSFASYIGGWLVYFGMNPWWMFGASTAIAIWFSCFLIRK